MSCLLAQPWLWILLVCGLGLVVAFGFGFYTGVDRFSQRPRRVEQ